VSDNNISNLDELPTGQVLNINYVGNPCWVDSPPESEMGSPVESEMCSPVESEMGSPVESEMCSPVESEMGSPVESEIDSNMSSPTDATSSNNSDRYIPFTMNYKPTGVNSNSSETPGPRNSYACLERQVSYNRVSTVDDRLLVPAKMVDDDGMTAYKAAISRSSSNEELQNVQKNKKIEIQCQKHELSYPGDDPLIKAIDYVVASGFRRVGSFIYALSDILTPESNYDAVIGNNSDSDSASPTNNNSIAGHVLDELDNYGILGSFD
jgi:hypothetical protein